jgi:hypothetical protein
MRSSSFHITLFFFGAVLHQRQASALAHAREEHVESFGRHRNAKLLHWKKNCDVLGFGILLGYNRSWGLVYMKA